MKKTEFGLEWTLITLTAAALVATLLVSCAPTHRSFSLSSGEAPTNTVTPGSENTVARSSNTPSAIVGNWNCEDDAACTVSKISVLQDGSALADGQKAAIAIEQKSQTLIHITFHVPAHDGIAPATLEGDVSTSREVNEISLNGATYARAADAAGN